jgi:hypothetical protein
LTNKYFYAILYLSKERGIKMNNPIFKVKYYAVETDQIKDNNGIEIVEDTFDDFESLSELLENIDENIIISIERLNPPNPWSFVW